jgi:hypothetical protein
VADFSSLEGEWSATTARPQCDGNDDRNDHREPVRSVGLDAGDLRRRQLAVADEAGTDEDGDATEDRGQVRLIERVDPVDVRQPLAAPDASPLE